MFTTQSQVHLPEPDGAALMPRDGRPLEERLADPRVRIGFDFGDPS